MRRNWDEEEMASEPLWRYFKCSRFVETLESKALYFAAVRQFSDPFEGAVAVVSADIPVDPRYSELEPAEKAFEELRRLTKLSCWHRADYESDAMWKLYAAARKGVAIRTTTDRLQQALSPFRLAPKYEEEEPYWGPIYYVVLHRERLRETTERRFFYKHRAFEWERELRVEISVRMAEEFGVPVPEHGVTVDFDPAVLIESVYIGPKLDDSEKDRVQRACEQAELECALVTSTLLGRPRYV